METEIPVAACKRIAALTVVIQPGGTGDEDFAPGFFSVIDPLQQISPSSVLMDFVQQDQRFADGNSAFLSRGGTRG